MNNVYKIFGAAALSLGLAACGSSSSSPLETPTPPAPEPEPEVGTVVDVAVDNGNFTTLVSLLQDTGLDATLGDPDGEFTVFAPTDDAFALLDDETLEYLADNPDVLEEVLLYHVIVGSEVNAEGAIAAAGSTIEMGNGDHAGIGLDGEDLYINLSLVTMADVNASNGVIHVIDTVMMPPEAGGDTEMTIAEIASGNDDFSTLVTALDAADLVSTLNDPDGEFTVFAPTNDAFAAIDDRLLQAILDDEEVLNALLMQHVIPGATVGSAAAYAAIGSSVEMGNGAELEISVSGEPGERVLRIGNIAISMVDIYASNGVIHVVDAVIVGDLDLPAPLMSIVEVAQDAGNFETLIAALEATGLDATLDDLEATFTVFAPTDEAFDKLGEHTINELLADTDRLENILLYHVLAGQAVMSGEAVGIAESDASILDMANGDQAALSMSGENLLINLSTVIDADVMAENGIIHAIDTVLMPPPERGEPTANIVETAIAADGFDTLVQLLSDAELVDTLSGEGPFTVFAPTDEAFDALDQETMDALAADQDLLVQVLLGHVIAAEVDSVTAYSLNGQSAATAADDFSVEIEILDGVLTVGGSGVLDADIYTSNGIIHVIDTVIVPPMN